MGEEIILRIKVPMALMGKINALEKDSKKLSIINHQSKTKCEYWGAFRSIYISLKRT